MEDYAYKMFVTTKLWTTSTVPEWISLEHKVQQILTEQEIHGWRFNEAAAWYYIYSLTRVSEIEQHYDGNTLTLQGNSPETR